VICFMVRFLRYWVTLITGVKVRGVEVIVDGDVVCWSDVDVVVAVGACVEKLRWRRVVRSGSCSAGKDL
jgi:hypothetical protein